MKVSSAPIRMGVIGCGNIAYWTHLREIAKLSNTVLVAASDPDASARERAAKLAKISVHSEATDLLARADIDAVVICVPTALHAEMALLAVEFGKHFYLEKPIAINAEDGERVICAAEKAGVVGVIGFNRRYHPAFLKARELISRGKIGRVRAVQTSFCEPIAVGDLPEWKKQRATGGGVLLDLASHHIDLVRWVLDDSVNSVLARIRSEASEQDSASLQILMDSGTEVAGFFSFQAGRSDVFEFIGDSGVLRVDRFKCQPRLQLQRRFGYGVRSAIILPDRDTIRWKLAKLLRPSWESSYRGCLQAFGSLCSGKASEVAVLGDGQESLKCVLAAEASAASGQWVRLENSNSETSNTREL